MTMLSVNVNKIALLRNSRGRDYPNVLAFVDQLISLGVKGITVHPRPDERHVTRQDAIDIGEFLKAKPGIEFNVEGYPSREFMDLVIQLKPDQCTLVPDEPGQLTSDHGWDVAGNKDQLTAVLAELKQHGIRSSLFLDPSPILVSHVLAVGADRIELYTEDFANNYGTPDQEKITGQYADTAAKAEELGIGVNAGHDLDLENLTRFLLIPNVKEVSIGHALVVESLQMGISTVVGKYLRITGENRNED
ncbi:MAG: pyridoxine 5'-phosphate synthase [Gammaproteobacteria bacterium]|jgi:pyridoxine 5-phosphate synthase|nr:pyridoxine 5'-phosphate synthase [Gammaproteobacteria bacterium]MBT3987910.1 pyridoxine 5'-phosphate synthase [Gammaproteobacteria bacterium]MBT4257144.1 pyridoxine 5'-phosphate synthase [Gammaproteobacteria bacterium]MBT4582437.1 pyridoxine 5'-phosphate synthase [Gammaproteobacteria bacterium]MBT4659170.1 pyridoxine 5'-phosphate synthase [Gammaproteobacteria bacterium]